MVQKITELQKVLIQKSKPLNKAAYFLTKAVKLSKEKKYAEAIACYDKVIELDPRSKAAWFNKALVSSHLDKHEEALTCYEEAIRIDPTYARSWFNKGVTCIRLKKIPEAIACFEEAVRLDPTDEIAKRNKTKALQWQKEKRFE
jgi:tetratricopeptide (TPR) repeat protein